MAMELNTPELVYKITADELEKVILDAVNRGIEAGRAEEKALPRYLSRTQVAQILGVSISSIDLWARSGRLVPKFYAESKPRYAIEDIENYILNSRRIEN